MPREFLAYPECYLNKVFAEEFFMKLKKLGIVKQVKVIHKGSMNVDDVIRRIEELKREISKSSSTKGLSAFFPDVEEDENKARRLTKAIDSLTRSLKKRCDAECVNKDVGNILEIVACRCKARDLLVIIVAFKGGIERALAKVGNIREGELEKHRRRLKGVRSVKDVPEPFKSAFNELIDIASTEVMNALKEISDP